MIQIFTHDEGKLIEVTVTESLSDKDYDEFIPILEANIQKHGKINLLWEMREFSGWKPKALFRDTAFSAKHANDFGKVAMVGEKQWQEWMTGLMKPFSSAEVKFFDTDEVTAAKAWVGE